MAAILVAEMRGFEAVSTQLAKELDEIGVTPERIRSTGIAIANRKLDEIAATIPPEKRMHLGGDTWYLTFESLTDAIRFGASFLATLRQAMVDEAIFFLKPSLAVSMGVPQTDGDRFLDNDSIQAYRAADGGRSFQFVAVGSAIGDLKAQTTFKTIEISLKNSEVGLKILWDQIPENKLVNTTAGIKLPTLLLDSEVIYSESSAQALHYLIQQQERSKTVLAFGGPVSLTEPTYRNYVRSFIAQLRERDAKFTLLSYIPLNEPRLSFGWLELCRRLSNSHPEKLAFSSFAIPEGQLRPFSYHVYDKNLVHIGLRSFSPQRGTPTMSGAIMFRNQKIASRFSDEFLENWRKLGPASEEKVAGLAAQIQGLNKDIRRLVAEDVDAVLNDP